MLNYEKKLQFSYDVNQKILNLISDIDMFKGKWSILENESVSYLNKLRNIATIQSVGSSTRIEGATLSDQEIKALIADLEVNKIETRDEQEVVGYYDALELIFENYLVIELTENYIKQLHGVLLRYSAKDDRQRGIYKKLTNKVVATYPDGTQKVVFNTTEPHLVPNEMGNLIAWTNQRFKDRSLHPLLVIGLLIYEFLSIHPFHDGNGRLSRLLTTLLLLRQDYNFIKYVSFEHLIEARKRRYYATLMECQQYRGSDREIINVWILFFLESLRSLATKLEAKIQQVDAQSKPYLSSRQKEIVEFIRNNEPCKISDIHSNFPNVSIHTLKKDLKYLVEISILGKTGQRKGTVYRVN